MFDQQAKQHGLNRILDRFDEQWQQAPVEIAAFLASVSDRELEEIGASRRDLIQELVCIDLEYRCRAAKENAVVAQQPRVEDYLAAWPELREGSPLSLIREEYRARLACGETPSLAEYESRFQEWASELKTEFQRVDERRRQEHEREQRLHATCELDTSPTQDTDTSPHRRTRLPQGFPEIPEYEMLELLGRGGMGMVVKARHKLLRRLVAIKIPLAHTMEDGGERFLREARAAASLRHQHLCAIHEVRQTAEFPYIVLAYVEGQTLDKWARSTKPNARQIAILIAKLARAMYYAHEHGIIHRDIKPGNVMVESASGEPVLMDFGLAKELESGDALLTRSGQVLGTPAFMSPEQATGRIETVGPLTDVYALGAVLYALICGRAPFAGSAGEVIHQLQSAEPPSPRKLAPHVHRDLETICQKAMNKDIAGRYSSALALAEDLERFAAGDAILARPISLPQRIYRRFRRHPATAGIVAVCVLALLVTGILVASSGRQQRRLVQLRQEYKKVLSDLDAGTADEVAARLLRLEELGRDIAVLSSTPATEMSMEVTAGLDSAIERRLNVERLSEQEVSALTKRIQLLEARDAIAGQRLARRLASKRVGWDAIVGLSGALDTIAASFVTPAAVTVEQGNLVRRPEHSKLHFAPVASSSVPAAANVRVEAEFILPEDAKEAFGIVLGASQGHTGDVLALDFSPDGKYLASGAIDGHLKVWNREKQELVHSRFFPGGGVTQAEFAQNGKIVALRNWGELYLYDWTTDKIVAQRKAVYPVSVSPQRRLVAVTELEQVSVLDIATGKELGAIGHLPEGRWRWLAFVDESRQIVMANSNDEVAMFDWTTGERLQTFTLGPDVQVTAMVYSHEARRVALATQSNRAIVFQVEDGREVANLTVPDHLTEMAISPDGMLLAAIFGGAGGRVWDVASQSLRFDLNPVNWGLYQLKFDHSGRHLLAASDNRAISWNTTTGKRNVNLIGHLSQVRALARHHAPPLAASGGRDNLIHVRDLQGTGPIVALGADRCAVRVRLDSSAQPPEAILQLELAGALVTTKRLTLTPAQVKQPQHLRVERVHGLIKVWLNPILDEAKPDLEFHEVFPSPASGVIGLVWPAAAAVSELIAYQRQEAEGLERLDFAEKFYVEGRFDDAAKMFHAVAVATADEPTRNADSLWQEATYKEAVSRQAAGDVATAEELFAQLQMAEGERWPLYALVQLWTIRLRAGDFQQAEALLNQAQQRGISFAQVTALIPEEIRAELIAIGRRDVGAIEGYYKYSPDRVDKARRLYELERLVYGQADGATQLRLIRALRLEGQLAAAQKVAREWLADGRMPGSDAIDELSWMLREEQKVDEAAALLDRFLVEESPDYDPRYCMLWIDRAYVDFARGDREAAQRCLDRFMAAADMEGANLARHTPQSALMAGFLLADQEGREEEAKQVWAQGLRVLLKDRGTQRRTAGDWLYLWLLSSLSGEGDDVELRLAFESLVSGAGSDSIIGTIVTMLTASPTGQERVARKMRGAFQSERGRDLARRIAYLQISFPDLVREPMLLLAVEVSGSLYRPDGLSPLEDEILWKLGEDFYDALIMKGTITSDQLTALAAGQVTPFLLTGALRQFNDRPELGAPLAYFSGLRQLNRKEHNVAAKCFEMAVSLAPPDSPTAKLAAAELSLLRRKP